MSESWEDKKRDEELSKIFADFRQSKQEKDLQEKQDKQKSIFLSKTRKLFTVSGAVLCVVLFIHLLALVFGKTSPFRSPEPWAIGDRYPSDYKIDGCIFRLWKVKTAVDLYYSDKKSFPQSMEQLYEGGYLKNGFTCPASELEYVFKTKDSYKVFCCPEPEKHSLDIKDIFCSVVNSPPVIER